jgi:hypothetical protein
LQQGGSVEIGPLFDGNKYCKNRINRMMFNRAKQFWTEERWIRVTGSDEKLKYTGINRQITLEDQIVEEFGDVPPELQGDPRLQMVVGVANPVNELDVDIIIDESPNTVTLQQEQFEVLSRLYEVNPNAIPFELIIKSSQLQNKDELLRLIQGGDEEQQLLIQQQQAEEEARLKQIAKANAMADIEAKQVSTAKDAESTRKIAAETEQIVAETAISLDEASEPTQETA